MENKAAGRRPFLDRDFIVLGSGVAGLVAALRLSRGGGTVALLSKESLEISNSRYAQGGIAAVWAPDDSADDHAADTLNAAAGLGNPAAIKVLVEEGPKRIEELIRAGMHFDTDGALLRLSLEGAHRRPRILHARGDRTGRELVQFLVEAVRQDPRITILEHWIGSRFCLRDGSVCGLMTQKASGEEYLEIRSEGVLLASGGYGAAWGETTNPEGSIGDGLVLAWDAGATLADLEFVQFHPTALHLPGKPQFLLTEALRGEGAILVDAGGRRFMPDYHPMGELAPRDVIARAIVEEKRRKHISEVFLDARGLGKQMVLDRFPGVEAGLAKEGLSLVTQPIPVAPAAHYSMGGVLTGLKGETTLPGLWAAGECAASGVHGANRLASNSLLECLVFGNRAAEAMLETRGSSGSSGAKSLVRTRESQDEFDYPHPLPVERVRGLMDQHLGVERDSAGLEEMVDRFADGLEKIESRTAPLSTEALRRRSLNIVAGLVAIFAQSRLESRGAHFRRDAPETSTAWGFRQTLTKLCLDRLAIEATHPRIASDAGV